MTNDVRTEKDTGREKAMKKRRLKQVLAKILLCATVLVSAVAAAFLILQISGKGRLYSKADNSAMITTLAELATVMEEGEADDVEWQENWQEGDIRYQGKHYRYNDDVLVFLFLGIDKMEEVRAVPNGLQGGQSDAIFLLVLNPDTGEATIIGIPRDTMAEIDVYSEKGTYLGRAQGQITLQHGYGDGAKLSCERTREAVSRLFYGLSINGYCSVNMGAIPLLNDAVGGVQVVSLETLDTKDFHVKEGEQLWLQGMDAYHYLHYRDTGSFGSAVRRLERQKQYLGAYSAALLEKLKGDITFVTTLYGTLSRYMVTDITVDAVSYLATQVAGYRLGAVRTLEGETVMGKQFEEFYVDEKALYELILDVFYERVGE